MPRQEDPTNRQLRVPVVLVVGGTPDLAAIVDEAAVAAQVLVHRCALEDVATVAAEIRPVALVMSEDIFLFDPPSFQALARDVHAMLLPLREGRVDLGKLQGKLKALAAVAEESGPGWSGEQEPR